MSIEHPQIREQETETLRAELERIENQRDRLDREKEQESVEWTNEKTRELYRKVGR